MKTDQDLDHAAHTLYRAFISQDPTVEPTDIEQAAFTLRVAAVAHPNGTVRELAADIGIAATAPTPEPMRLAAAALAAELDYTEPLPHRDIQLRIFDT
jgi:hypothetical protein